MSMAMFELYNVDGRSLDLYGFTQVYYEYSNNSNNTFALRRSRLIFKVKEGENIDFKMQVDFLKVPSLLDVYMRYKKGAFLFKIGRFLPDFTFYMPHSSTSLDFVDYPLLIKTWGMWRQIGLEFTYLAKENLYAKTGIFNGPKNNYRDVDGMKDVMFKLGYKTMCSNAGVYAYSKRENLKEEKLFGTYWDFRPKRYIFTAEPLFVVTDSGGVVRRDLSYYLQVGGWLRKGLKTLIRFEEQYIDIDTKPLPVQRVWIGLVKEFNNHFKLYANYIKGIKKDNTKDLVLQLQCKW